MDRIGWKWIEVDCTRPKQIEWTEIDLDELDGPNRPNGPNWTEVQRIGLKQTKVD